jgi:hypothetical protein
VLRHSTASLLMMAGANPAAVQRIMRHSDPKLTTEVYGHLAPEYLRAEVDRLSFGTAPAELEESLEAVALIKKSGPFVPLVSPQRARAREQLESASPNRSESEASFESGRRGSNPRPRAWEARALPAELLPHRSNSSLASRSRACQARSRQRGADTAAPTADWRRLWHC